MKVTQMISRSQLLVFGLRCFGGDLAILLLWGSLWWGKSEASCRGTWTLLTLLRRSWLSKLMPDTGSPLAVLRTRRVDCQNLETFSRNAKYLHSNKLFFFVLHCFFLLISNIHHELNNCKIFDKSLRGSYWRSTMFQVTFYFILLILRFASGEKREEINIVQRTLPAYAVAFKAESLNFSECSRELADFRDAIKIRKLWALKSQYSTLLYIIMLLCYYMYSGWYNIN